MKAKQLIDRLINESAEGYKPDWVSADGIVEITYDIDEKVEVSAFVKGAKSDEDAQEILADTDYTKPSELLVSLLGATVTDSEKYDHDGEQGWLLTLDATEENEDLLDQDADDEDTEDEEE